MQTRNRDNNRNKRNQPATWISILLAAILLVIYVAQQVMEAPQETLPQAPQSAATQVVAQPIAEAEATPATPATRPEQPSAAEITAGETPGSQGNPGAEIDEPAADFDFYLLALSWSPEYCETNNDTRSQQCKIGRKLGFVLHGLWPNYRQGYPSYCSDQKLPKALKETYAGLYPSASLFDHEWEKHGTCSGLSPEAYLALSKLLKEKVAIPPAYHSPGQPLRVTPQLFREQFVALNPGLGAEGMAVFCSGSGRFLSELQLCFTPGGEFTACSQEMLKNSARSCGRSDFLVRNVR